MLSPGAQLSIEITADRPSVRLATERLGGPVCGMGVAARAKSSGSSGRAILRQSEKTLLWTPFLGDFN